MEPLPRFVASSSPRRRVLIECADAETGLATARALHDAGYAVATCPGPRAGEPCPELTGHVCGLAANAGAIVSDLTGNADGRRVVACLRARYPETPLLLGLEPCDAVGAVTGALAG
jgi:NAD(P)-dependent dehydrogenase (short-subunit alcohol dehydrogenase family)